MRIEYGVSAWNFTHYSHVSSLECIILELRELGYGIEFWESYRDEPTLFDWLQRRALRRLLQGMRVSIHYEGPNTLRDHKRYIDAACELGAGVVVVYPRHLAFPETERLDVALARKVVTYAADHGVRMALKNGPAKGSFAFLSEAVNEVEGLGVCLDTGHLYLHDHSVYVPAPTSMGEFLECLGGRLIHLHIQDILSEGELGLPSVRDDHFVPGTGGIPEEDWELLAKTLYETDFDGMAVFEIRPRNPLQTALLGKEFMQRLLQQQTADGVGC